MWFDILKYYLICSAGGVLGFFLGAWFSIRNKVPVGTIFVTQEEDKIVYSLEVDDDPAKLQFEKEVVFNIDTSRESLNRD